MRKPGKRSRETVGPTASKYGHFSPDGRQYVVTDPNTPRPWVNYLTNGDYCALCSHVGGGYSFYKDHRFNSVLARGEHQRTEDLPGRFVYIKDEDSGEVWTANAHPVGKFTTFQARHGAGYTMIDSSYSGIGSTLRFFVPQGIDAEMWTIELVNRGRKDRRLSVYSMAELALGNVSLYQHEPFYQGLFHEARLEDNLLVATHKFHFTEAWSEICTPWSLRVIMTATKAPQRMLMDRAAFFGGLRDYRNPVALEDKFLPKGATVPRDLVAVNQWRVKLAPGKAWQTHLSIAVQPNEDSRANTAQIASLRKAETYERAWERTQAFWSELFESVHVETPEPNINVMMNTWNKIQLMTNFYFGRAPSYYHKSQYPGMRDCCQDAYGVLAMRPELAGANLRRIAQFFFSDGQACGGCNRLGLKEKTSIKVDLPLWFVLAVADYVRETGDFGILDESYPLMDGGESTVYAKMLAGVDRMIDLRGPHGLPLIGKGDWNDPANRIGAEGKGESVWLAEFVYLVIAVLEPFMQHKGDTKKLQGYRKRAEELRRIVNESCWDGEWFVRAFRDDGRPLGVRGQKEGYIWINSQTWAVIGNIANTDRLNACIDAVEKHMGTEFGLTNLAPAYTQYDISIGRITCFRAGWKENGAVFSHASSFNVVARAMLGRGKDAVDLYRRILPMTKDSDQYLIEPYVYSQFCAGPAAGHEMGQGGYHWLSGTAAWMFRAMTDYIIGVRPELSGLRVRPAVDPSWKRFTLRRRFRGSTYEFEFENPDGVQTGVRQILLDGEPIEGDLLPVPTKRVHKVTVRMGKPNS